MKPNKIFATASSTCIRVLVVDDHDMVRSGLSAFLMTTDDLELVGEASDGEQAVQLADELRPDVVLMDLIMPGMDGVAATHAIRSKYPETQVIALTSFGEEKLVRTAVQAGAIAYLLKNVSADQLADAIRAAYAGRSTLSPEAAETLVRSASQSENRIPELTPRERQVLELMAEGLNNSQIAERLVVSRSTIKYHVSNILSKLGVTSRAEAIALAMRRHLIS